MTTIHVITWIDRDGHPQIRAYDTPDEANTDDGVTEDNACPTGRLLQALKRALTELADLLEESTRD